MPLVSGSIPNLIGGVSQQPPEIRALNTFTALSNTDSSVVSGLTTRNNADFLADIGSKPGSDSSAATHGIQKNSGSYEVVVSGGSVTVVNLDDGTLPTLNADAAALTYLTSTDSAKNIRFSTVGDTTFILNRGITVAKTNTVESGLTGITEDGQVRQNPYRYSTFWIKQIPGYDHTITISFDGVEEVSTVYSTANRADVISEDLRNSLVTAGYTATAQDPHLFVVTHGTEGVASTITDSFGNQGVLSYDADIDVFTDLPAKDIPGRLVQVLQDDTDDGDDYWVWYKDSAWQETYGWNAQESLDDTTLPVKLIDNKDGTWSLTLGSYKGRTVGDQNSNATPSFVGNKINALFRYSGRLVFLSGENLVASEKFDLENFYRTDCSQLLDNDRFDIASSESRGSDLVGARPFNNELLVFSEFEQFSLKGDSENLISPNTVSLDLVNNYNANPDVPPISVGPNVVFADDRFETNSFSRLREYQIERVFGKQVALPITDHVPEYIPSGVYDLLNIASQNKVLLVTSGDRRTVYSYDYYYNNDGKVQASWQKWNYHVDVYGVDYVNDRVILVVENEGRFYVLKQSFDEGIRGSLGDNDILLDFKISSADVTMTLVGANTEVTFPYDITGDPSDFVAVVSFENSGPLHPVKVFERGGFGSTTKTVIFPNVDLTGNTVFFGHRFTFEWELSPFFLRDQKLVVIQDGRLQIRRASVVYNNSGPFEVWVTPQGRDTFVKVFSGYNLGGSLDLLGTRSFNDGIAKFSCPGQPGQCTVKIVAKTPWRVGFSSAEWQGMHRPKSRRT